MPSNARVRTLGVFILGVMLLGVLSIAGARELDQTYRFDAPSWMRLDDGSGFEIPSIKGARTIGHPGEPMMPVFTARILLPPGEEVVSVRVIETSAPLESRHLPAPAEHERPYSDTAPWRPIEPRADIYGSSALYPDAAANLVTVQTYRGHRVAYVNLFPLRVRPADRTASFTDEMTVVVTTAPDPSALSRSSVTYRSDTSTERWLWRNVDNPSVSGEYRAMLADDARPAPSRSLVDPALTRLYVIITSTELEPVFAALAEDRTRKGLPAEIVIADAIQATYEGRDAQEKVRNFILDAYQNWDTEYVLFAGDIDVIPDRDCYCYVIDEGSPIETNNLCSELYYQGLDASWNDDDDDRWGEPGEEDLLPDVHIGRVASDNSTEAQNFIDKLLLYERQPIAGEIESASFFGEYLWEETWGGMYMEEIRLGADTWGYTTAGVPLDWATETFYEMDGGSWSGSDYIAEMNSGVHMMHHLGHSSSGSNCKVYTSDIPSFTADGVAHTHNVGYSQGCDAGSFDTTDSILESFVLSPTGYVAFVGNTRYGFGVHYTTNGSSQYYHRQYADALFAEGINELAAANNDSRTDNVGYIDYESNRWVHYEITAFGDPAMPVWTGTPQTPELDHAGVVILGAPDYPVTVQAGGVPVAGARVCMWDDAATTYSYGVTDAEGSVLLAVEPTYPGTMHIVVSDADLRVTDIEVPIIPDGPYIVIESHAISDAAGGNDDGDCDAGETIDLQIELANVWSGTISGVTATLSCGTGDVQITDDAAVYGDFAGGEVKLGLGGDAFAFHVDGACPDQTALEFTLQIEDDADNTWSGQFAYPASAALLTILSLEIDDAEGGDGDGCLDPGESAQVSIYMANGGHADAESVEALLHSGSGYLTITQPDASCLLIPAGGDALLAPPLEVTLSADAPSPGLISCALTLEGAWELAVTLPAEIGVGGLADDMESGEGAWTHEVVSSGFGDQWHLSTLRNHSPGGEASWKFGDTGAGDYMNLADGALITEPIAVASATVLTFWHWIDAEESGAYPGRCYDGGMVEISYDGEVWTQITPDGGYSHTIRAGSVPGPFPEDTPVFSGARDWHEETFTLETTPGVAQFRFRFGSDGADTREGWYIDDARIRSWDELAGVADSRVIRLRPVLHAALPNPFSPSTQIAFELPEAGDVHVSIHDLQGRTVRTLIGGHLAAGTHRVIWDGKGDHGRALGAGVYFCRLDSGTTRLVRKIALIR